MAVLLDRNSDGAKNVATSGNSGTDLEWVHTFGASPTAVIVAIDAFPSDLAAWSSGVGKSYTEFERVVTIDDIPMNLLEIRDVWPGHVDGYLHVWGLIGSDVQAMANRAVTVRINEKYKLDPSLYYPWIHGNSVSYSGAVAFNHAGFSANVHNASISIASGEGHMVYSAFAGSRWSSGSGTWRYYYTNLQTGGRYEALIVQDQPGTSPTATATASSIDHGAVAHTIVDMIPGEVSDPPLIRTTAIDPMSRGQDFSQIISISGTEPLSLFVTGNLPNGITFDGETRTFSGVPTLAGNFAFTLHATNEVGEDTADYIALVGQVALPFIPTTNPPVTWYDSTLDRWYAATVEVLHDDDVWRPAILES